MNCDLSNLVAAVINYYGWEGGLLKRLVLDGITG